jgi:shikimate kinase
MTVEGIREMMDSRRAAYEEAADVHIKTDELTIDDVSGKVLSCVTT